MQPTALAFCHAPRISLVRGKNVQCAMQRISKAYYPAISFPEFPSITSAIVTRIPIWQKPKVSILLQNKIHNVAGAEFLHSVKF